MLRTIEKDGKKILELSRKERHWLCSECNKEYSSAPTQCVCGASDKVFMEKDCPIKESTRREYEVLGNFIYDLKQINKGSIVSLIEKDRATKNLLKSELIKLIEVPEVAKEEIK